MTEEQIKHMVSRFLGWKLPEDFRPDDGISFDPIMNKGHAFESRRTPSGTNLFDATQADAMVRYMVEGMAELQKRPVAFRVKDHADGWIVFQNESDARNEAERTDALMQGLYVRDGK